MEEHTLSHDTSEVHARHFVTYRRLIFRLGKAAIIAMAVPLQTVNDIVFTHLHIDHGTRVAPELQHNVVTGKTT